MKTCRPTTAVLLLALAAGSPVAAAQTLATPEQALALVNAQRAAGARCGGEPWPPAPPLQWHAAAEAAAAEHLHDVAQGPRLRHRGSDGSTVGDRLRRHGYGWGAAGENLAAGHASAAQTLQQWLQSPAHCRTLMQADFQHAALVGRRVAGSRYGAYWVMVLARPLE